MEEREREEVFVESSEREGIWRRRGGKRMMARDDDLQKWDLGHLGAPFLHG